MYATVANMVERFGNTEMVRLSVPEDRETDTLDPAKIEVALADATALIDGYLRGRYKVPLADVPKDIVRAACVLSRYDLAKGERVEPTEQMRLERKEVITWLENIAKGLISIEAASAGTFGKSNGPRFSGRPATFSDESLKGW